MGSTAGVEEEEEEEEGEDHVWLPGMYWWGGVLGATGDWRGAGWSTALACRQPLSGVASSSAIQHVRCAMGTVRVQ